MNNNSYFTKTFYQEMVRILPKFKIKIRKIKISIRRIKFNNNKSKKTQRVNKQYKLKIKMQSNNK